MTRAGTSTLDAAEEVVRARTPLRSPVAGIVLGSGLGGLARRMTGVTAIPYRDIPGFATAYRYRRKKRQYNLGKNT